MTPEDGAHEDDHLVKVPLAGTLVVDVSVTIPGPYATSLLGRFGARVIKFEPKTGDITRMFPHLHDALNRGKESVAVDLKDPEDIALVRAAADRADVFVEGWRPGVAARLGLGAKELRRSNPRLVYCSLSGYGASGPLSDRPGHDLNYIAASGMAKMLFGERAPHPMGVPLADLAGGTFAALRILGALVEASSTGRGSFIDVSLGGSVREWVEAIGGAVTEETLGPLGDLPHYGVFETADGELLSLGTVNEDHFWIELCKTLDLMGWQDLGFLERATRSSEIRPTIERAVKALTRAELERALSEAVTCWAFVESPTSAPPIGGMMPPYRAAVPSLDEHGPAIRTAFAGPPTSGKQEAAGSAGSDA